ncbi:MAG: SRPBCC domain-containing protein [Bacteroidales bacterium]|nr:SRPBCC domain-containing protein [Bacteroidales bacterium]
MKKKLTLEYTLNSSPKILYPRLSTPGGLSEWFADDVNLKRNIYFFIWEGTEQRAEVVRKKENHYIQFRWLDDPDEPTFEFRINVDELTGDVALEIQDTIDEEDEDDVIGLWDSQIAELKHVLGS